MRPISERWLRYWKSTAGEFVVRNEDPHLAYRTIVKLVNELRSARAAIRKHRDEVSEVSCPDQDIKEVDRDLWKATLPEGDR